MPYQPIENYGVIGNLRTAALVSRDGSIDWLCFPNFDSPSVFAAILDDKKGGRFRITTVAEDLRLKQFYWPETNVLVTRFYTEEGVGELLDFMPVGVANPHQVIRRLRVTRGRLRFRLDCAPAFDYARAKHTTELVRKTARFAWGEQQLELATVYPLEEKRGAVSVEFDLSEGETTTVVLRLLKSDEEGKGYCPLEPESDELFRGTVNFWRNWLSHCTYTGRWREVVHRSALALKLLTYEPTGAIVAAPTCSLPEEIGGERNWDYRYTWIRDAAFSLYGLLRIGFHEEAVGFMGWLEQRARESDWGADGPLQNIYRIDGSRELPEFELGHLEGYMGSKPVRVGNGAANQLQLDIYGELFDAAYLSNKYAAPLSIDAWQHFRRMLGWLAENWQRPDEGIWEVRGGRSHFVYSKLMSWVAFDRGLRLADKRSFPADRQRWLQIRDQIYEEVLREGWSELRQSFAQSYGTDLLDASNLIMPLVFFLAPSDPLMLKTLEAMLRPPREGGLVADGLIHRYDPTKTDDGLEGLEGTFNMCSFWLVEALTRAGRTDPRKLDDARLLFERMLGYANNLGLYSEQTGFNGQALGNYPQGFTHLSLISAAFNLDRTLGAAR